MILNVNISFLPRFSIPEFQWLSKKKRPNLDQTPVCTMLVFQTEIPQHDSEDTLGDSSRVSYYILILESSTFSPYNSYFRMNMAGATAEQDSVSL